MLNFDLNLKNDKKTNTVTSFVISSLQPFRWQLAGTILVAVYFAIHVSLQPYIIKLIIDRIATDPSFSNIANPVIAYIIISVIFTLNFRFYDYIALYFYPKLKADIAKKAVQTVSKQSYVFFHNQFAGGLADTIKNLSKGTYEIIVLFVDDILGHCLALVVAFITLLNIHYALAFILLGWAVTLVTISALVTKKARYLSNALSVSSSRVTGTIVDIFTNILTVKLFSAQKFENEIIDEQLLNNIKLEQKLRWFTLKFLTLQGLSTSVMVSSCLLILIFSVQSHHITLGDFALVFSLSLTFADIFWNLAREISSFSEVYGVVNQGVSLINLHEEIQETPDATPLLIHSGEIRFEKVDFHYPNSIPLFKNQSITLHPGQKVGLVGYSGSGKSTFINLILRLYDVNSGKILIDGQDIKEVTLNSLYQSIAVIPQDPTLFHRTLKENIAYGQEISEYEIIEAAKKAQAHEFIVNLPNGYDTLVGERGIKLSGGQRQRIAIARAILKNTPILLLDEATSALDSITENLIKDCLLNLMAEKTTLVIAHRLSTLLYMDRILVFDQGKIIENGSHTELLNKKGMYKALWDAQIGGFIPRSKTASLSIAEPSFN